MRVIFLLQCCGCIFAFLTPACATQEQNTSECGAAIKAYSDLNANGLFNAFLTCAQSEDYEDANVMIMLGQIRAMADMTILTPIDDQSSKKVSDLYSQLFYRFGGLGFDEVYRDPQNVDRLASRIEDAFLNYASDYDPGWSYKQSSKFDIYDEVVSNTKRQRIWQMRNFALLIQDDAYFEAHLAHADLQRKNPVFEKGTPAYEESARLNALMREASSNIEQLPQPEDKTPYERLNEPDPDAKFKQLAFGFNGPATQSTDLFRSERQVKDSWLSSTYSDSDLAEILAAVDFDDSTLVSYNFGKRMNASGAIMISELSYSEIYESYSLYARLGVVPKSCGEAFTASYPFVLGTIDAVSNGEVRSSGSSNFPDDCGPIVSAHPSGDN